MRDVIVLAEFDELTGPRPLECWPHNRTNRVSSTNLSQIDNTFDNVSRTSDVGPVNGGISGIDASLTSPATPSSSAQLPETPKQRPEVPEFDLDALILRIMTVDLQSVASVGEQNRFRITEDSQVILSEKSPTMFAFVHHFVLHDLNARGFVRPHCLIYITNDEDKLLKYYTRLSADFTKTCRLLKYGNQCNFVKDLDQREQDLVHTLGLLSEETHEIAEGSTTSETASANRVNVKSINQALGDINMVQLELARRPWDLEFKLKCDRQIQRSRPQSPTRSRAYTASSPTSYIREDCGTPDLEAEGNRTRSNSLVEAADVAPLEPTYTPQYATVLKHKMFNTELKDINQLCGPLYDVAKKKIQATLKRYRLKHNELLLGAEESRAVDFPTSFVLTIGRCLLLSFQLPNSKCDKGPKQDRNISPDKLTRDQRNYSNLSNFTSMTSRSQFVDERDRSHSVGAHSAQSVYIDATEELRQPDVRYVGVDYDVESISSYIPQNMMLKAKRRQRLQNSAEHIALHSEYKPGFGILRLRNHCSFLPHLIYSLLHGRTVVVIGNAKRESEVRAMITTLWLFVPGHSENEKVISWRDSRPLQLADLAQVKLIGLSKQVHNGLPKSVERYVSVLDIESESFTSPKYHGTLIGRLLHIGMEVNDERVLLATIHSEFLDWASVAFLYFHMHCLESKEEDKIPDFDSSCLNWANKTKKNESVFLAKHGVEHSDVKIVKYLAQVVKTQQVGEYDKCRGRSGGGRPVVHLDFAKPHKFSNSKGPFFG